MADWNNRDRDRVAGENGVHPVSLRAKFWLGVLQRLWQTPLLPGVRNHRNWPGFALARTTTRSPPENWLRQRVPAKKAERMASVQSISRILESIILIEKVETSESYTRVQTISIPYGDWITQYRDEKWRSRQRLKRFEKSQDSAQAEIAPPPSTRSRDSTTPKLARLGSANAGRSSRIRFSNSLRWMADDSSRSELDYFFSSGCFLSSSTRACQAFTNFS